MSSTTVLLLLIPLIPFTSPLSPSKALPKIRCNAIGECMCPEDPLTQRYPDPQDPTCQSYYLCHLNRAHRKLCQVRTAFHPAKAECIPRQEVPESYCKLPIQCPVFSNRYVEDPHDCTKYYLCFYQRPSHYGCEEHHYFDPEQQKCIRDQLQAEACLELAKLENAERMKMEPNMTISSSALEKVKGNKEKILKEKGKPTNPEPKHFIHKLSPLGKALMGGTRG